MSAGLPPIMIDGEEEIPAGADGLRSAVLELLKQVAKRDLKLAQLLVENQRLESDLQAREQALARSEQGRSEIQQALARSEQGRSEIEQALTAQVSQLGREVLEIRLSRGWRTVLRIRRLSGMLFPAGSLQARLLGGLTKLRGDLQRKRDLEIIRASGLFEADWYLAHNPDVARAKTDPALHYLLHGGFEGRDPGPSFSTKVYLATYADVRYARINPLLHYLKYGRKEGRVAYDDSSRSE